MDSDALLLLVSRFFIRMGYTVEYGLKYEGFSGLLHTLDLLIRKDKEEHALFVMDWRRTIGINMIIKADKTAEDIDILHPIIVARRFSDHAKAYANKKRIVLMTEKELLSKLGENR